MKLPLSTTHSVALGVALLLGSTQSQAAPDEIHLSAEGVPQQTYSTSASSTWWSEDVWAAPDRPFLYYGEGRDVRPAPAQRAPQAATKATTKAPSPPSKAPAPPAKDQPIALERLTTMAEVRAEYNARLDRAVMNPTTENIEAFLAVNAFALERSHRFAEAFDRGRITHPAYDWTSTHPSANFASTELGQLRDNRTEALLTSLKDDVGLLFVGGADDALNALAAGPVRRFAAASGLELLAVHTAHPIEGLASKPDNGIVASVFGALHLAAPEVTLPALVLIPRPGTTHPAVVPLQAAPLLIASGVQSVSELKRRTVLLLATTPRAPLSALPTAPSAALIDRIPGGAASADFSALPPEAPFVQ